MSDTLLTRLKQIASDILPGQKIETSARGEGYYVFEVVDASGARSTLPPVWIDPEAGDRQIHEKLSRAFEQAYNPDSAPGDLSVPNIQVEEKGF